jgi:hypothetical protein
MPETNIPRGDVRHERILSSQGFKPEVQARREINPRGRSG